MGSTDSFGKGNQCCRPRFILSGSSSTMQDIWVHESNWYYLILHMQNQESTPAVQAELQKRLIFDAPGDQRPSYRQRQAAKLTEIIRTCPVLDDESTSHFLLVLSAAINQVHTFESWFLCDYEFIISIERPLHLLIDLSRLRRELAEGYWGWTDEHRHKRGCKRIRTKIDQHCRPSSFSWGLTADKRVIYVHQQCFSLIAFGQIFRRENEPTTMCTQRISSHHQMKAMLTDTDKFCGSCGSQTRDATDHGVLQRHVSIWRVQEAQPWIWVHYRKRYFSILWIDCLVR